jgi:hypothetical protein
VAHQKPQRHRDVEIMEKQELRKNSFLLDEKKRSRGSQKSTFRT